MAGVGWEAAAGVDKAVALSHAEKYCNIEGLGLQ